ncbi:hypothetical protein GCM10011331_19810 [Flavimobilis marinus]|uniref:SH3 domain-containing protein n=1 Tax=Flavimobilis marinus TaxID=285351 RepID=A0A1I2H5F4_9MICO|nr:hypothetical protein [Flavimobilis marinus]GHG54224.1 hypothetical protein GCM10011331_19810 [Flavimobilis marinus]SFF24639.1 hypothetical protein SAMN04488035_2191 [Flavimobilis marinus]
MTTTTGTTLEGNRMTTHARAPRAFLTLATALALVASPAAVASAAAVPVAATTVSTTAAPTALPGAVVTAKKKAAPRYQTKVRTVVYTKASGSKKRATIPADYTVKAVSAKKKNSRIQVVYKGKRGWVKASKISRVSSSTKLGKMSWAGSAKKNIKRWCKGVPVKVNKVDRNYASAWSDGSRELIELSRVAFGEKLDPNHPLAVATQYHECGHILQYRAYGYDFVALRKAMDKVYPKGEHPGIEHMADCISDVMGAKRYGSLGQGRTYYAGYGGDCSKKQLKAAKRIIAGKRL